MGRIPPGPFDLLANVARRGLSRERRSGSREAHRVRCGPQQFQRWRREVGMRGGKETPAPPGGDPQAAAAGTIALANADDASRFVTVIGEAGSGAAAETHDSSKSRAESYGPGTSAWTATPPASRSGSESRLQPQCRWTTFAVEGASDACLWSRWCWSADEQPARPRGTISWKSTVGRGALTRRRTSSAISSRPAARPAADATRWGPIGRTRGRPDADQVGKPSLLTWRPHPRAGPPKRRRPSKPLHSRASSWRRFRRASCRTTP